MLLKYRIDQVSIRVKFLRSLTVRRYAVGRFLNQYSIEFVIKPEKVWEGWDGGPKAWRIGSVLYAGRSDSTWYALTWQRLAQKIEFFPSFVPLLDYVKCLVDRKVESSHRNAKEWRKSWHPSIFVTSLRVVFVREQNLSADQQIFFAMKWFLFLVVGDRRGEMLS